jgi:transposase
MPNYHPIDYKSENTLKQLLARSRYLLFKSPDKWTASQKLRAGILFENDPDLQKAYSLTSCLRMICAKITIKGDARLSLTQGYDRVEKVGFRSFNTIAGIIYEHYNEILFFSNLSTNGSTKSFNAKIETFRAYLKGVVDIKNFFYRLTIRLVHKFHA